jgi:hypothetical protein
VVGQIHRAGLHALVSVLFPSLDLAHQSLVNLYRVIRHANKAMFSVDPLCVDQRDEGVVQLLPRQTEGIIFAETECCRFCVHAIKLRHQRGGRI